ncbi:capsular biosynthesis protein [Photobacterium damselae subsp. damselae]|uniref:capsular biosynthesis protein n=1 Tax=Photobacterium damselae TaxID=38293 RepID=UPI000A2FCF6A|nr:capsular biosynthesis protein [Photobacterium damselae]ARR49856.1 capsular biosynthesis protein [Photobacterium damselae subsp. damselae]QAY35598.1 capsular biosynthesis protein [Photobacterium damselae subsp. damselae]
MFLIMSSAYIGSELQSEFGLLPPSFLPLGNRRLFVHQNSIIPSNVKKYISIPETYKLSKIDHQWLTDNKIKVLVTPDGLSLGGAVVAALNLVVDSFNSPLHILFGDTYLSELPLGNDIVAIAETDNSYNWAKINNESSSQWLTTSVDGLSISDKVVCGYFNFSQPRQLISNITQGHWDFLEGLRLYNEKVGLTSKITDCWLDFGHINTYYRSKAKFTTQRAFNELVITPEWIEKSSVNNLKIKAEANWFTKLPSEMRNYIPQFMGTKESSDKFSYRLEYLHHTALNELYVFSELPTIVWNNIFDSCFSFLQSCQQNHAPNNEITSSIDELFGEKTMLRLKEYCTSKNISIEDEWIFDGELISIETILDSSTKWLPREAIPPTVMHGDFCFSNILYDFRTNRIKTIDPRGINYQNTYTIFGDIRYDLAKLSHSILGMYDWIIAGNYSVDITGNCIKLDIDIQDKQQEVQALFIEQVKRKFNLTKNNLYAMQIQLFLSMLPLHSDDSQRQDALFANAFRLYKELNRNIK